MKNNLSTTRQRLADRFFFVFRANVGKRLLTLSFLLFLLPSDIFAVSITIVSNVNWSAITSGSGSGGLPGTSDVIDVRNNCVLTVDISNAVCASMQLGWNSNPSKGNGTLYFNSGSSLTVSGIITLGNGGKVGKIDMQNGGILACNSLAISGTGTNVFVSGAGSIEMTSSNTLPSSVFTIFNNLTLRAGTTALGANITVNGTLTFSGSGALSLNGKTLTYGASSVLNYAGSLHRRQRLRNFHPAV